MNEHFLLSTVTRIASLEGKQLEIAHLPRDRWQRGDYVVGEVLEMPGLKTVELTNGRMAEVAESDRVIGALGKRMATLEAVGDWQDIGEDGRFQLLTPGGLMGRLTSCSPFLPNPISLAYRGHVWRGNKPLRMDHCIRSPACDGWNFPVVLIVGTSMSAGKTTVGKVIIRQLKRAGLKVIGAKLTGAARYRDVLGFGDAGADWIYDFVDMGLPSTVCPPDLFRKRLNGLLASMTNLPADVLVAEAGASPLEPYNGTVAVEALEKHVCCTILCASDPYAVIGVASAFGCQPDIVAGGAANTTAGIALVKKLCGIEALNLLESRSLVRLNRILSSCLNIDISH